MIVCRKKKKLISAQNRRARRKKCQLFCRSLLGISRKDFRRNCYMRLTCEWPCLHFNIRKNCLFVLLPCTSKEKAMAQNCQKMGTAKRFPCFPSSDERDQRDMLCCNLLASKQSNHFPTSQAIEKKKTIWRFYNFINQMVVLQLFKVINYFLIYRLIVQYCVVNIASYGCPVDLNVHRFMPSFYRWHLKFNTAAPFDKSRKHHSSYIYWRIQICDFMAKKK